jgi:hypothetical protein
MYSSRFKIPEERLIKYLWGDHFYNPTTKTFSDCLSKESPRFFTNQILKPLGLFYNAAAQNEKEVLSKMIERLGL